MKPRSICGYVDSVPHVLQIVQSFSSLTYFALLIAAAMLAVTLNAISFHPVIRTAVGLSACLILAAATELAMPGASAAVSLQELRRLHLFDDSAFAAHAVNSFLQIPVFLLLIKLIVQASQGEWPGLLGRLTWIALVAYALVGAAGFGGILVPVSAAFLAGVQIAASFVLAPAWAALIVFAIIGLVRHIRDCPWPVLRKFLRRFWFLPLGCSMFSLAGIFVPAIGWAFKATAAVAAVCFMVLGLRWIAARNSRQVQPAEFDLDGFGVTPREKEVALRLIDGWTYRDVAGFLKISPSTVKTHIQSVYRKTGAANKLELHRLVRQSKD